ncbi:MAG: hypothetical protein QXF12_07295 [Candidatus Aenigmatarchaeota archaeon]
MIHSFSDLIVANDIQANMKLYNIEYYSDQIKRNFRNKSILNFNFSLRKKDRILKFFTSSLCFFYCKYDVMFEISFLERYILKKVFVLPFDVNLLVRDIITGKSFLIDLRSMPMINNMDIIYLKKFLKLFFDSGQREKKISDKEIKENIYIRNLERFFYSICFVIFRDGLIVEEEKGKEIDIINIVKKISDHKENINFDNILESNSDTMTKSLSLYVLLNEKKKIPTTFEQFLKETCFSDLKISFEDFRDHFLTNEMSNNLILKDPKHLLKYRNSFLLKLDQRTIDCFITLVFNYIQKKRFLLWQEKKSDYLKILLKSKFLEIGKQITAQRCCIFHIERYTSSVFFIKIYDRNYNVFSFTVKERDVLKKFPLFETIPEISGVVNSLIRDKNIRENHLAKVKICLS